MIKIIRSTILLILVLTLSACGNGSPQQTPAESLEESAGKPDSKSGETDLFSDREKVYQLYAKKVLELEESTGLMNLSSYQIDFLKETWHSVHGVTFLKLIDLDGDEIEELIVVCGNPEDVGEQDALDSLLMTWGHPESYRKIIVFGVLEEECAELAQMNLGGGGSPVIHQIGFGEYEEKPCLYRWIGSGSREVYVMEEGKFTKKAEEERTEGLDFYHSKAYRLPSPSPEEDWYYFDFSHEEYELHIDRLVDATNDSREMLGLDSIDELSLLLKAQTQHQEATDYSERLSSATDSENLGFAIREYYPDRIVILPMNEGNGLNDNTIIGSMHVTFGEMCTSLASILPNEEPFPKEVFRQLVACELGGNEILDGYTTERIIFFLAHYYTIAYEFRDKISAINSATYMNDDPPELREYEVKLINGKTERWKWDSASYEFYIGENGNQLYESSMFSRDVIDIWMEEIWKVEDASMV